MYQIIQITELIVQHWLQVKVDSNENDRFGHFVCYNYPIRILCCVPLQWNVLLQTPQDNMTVK